MTTIARPTSVAPIQIEKARRPGYRAVAAVVVFLIILSIVFFLPPTTTRNSYLAATIEKHRLLSSTPAPRIVVLGGSNAAFGIDSQLLHRTFKQPVVNMGLHGGIGLRYSLNEYMPYCQKNDLVVVSPEYPQFDDPDGDYDLLHLLYVYPVGLRYVTWPNLCSFPKGYKQLLHFKRVWWQEFGFKKPPVSHIYHRFAFNSNGDVISHQFAPPVDHSKIFPPAINLIESEPATSPTVDLLKQFNDYCKSRGARVLLVYPPTTPKYYQQNVSSINKLDAALRNNTDITIVGNPSHAVFEDTDFFDTVDHLTWKGREKRTSQIAEDLQAIEL